MPLTLAEFFTQGTGTGSPADSVSCDHRISGIVAAPLPSPTSVLGHVNRPHGTGSGLRPPAAAAAQ
eukprot:362044-Hanusia_phi.AAC.1